MYWRALVVSNLLRMEFNLVKFFLFLCRLTLWLIVSFLCSAFEYTYLIFWNSFWTIAPVIAIGLFDRFVGMCLHDNESLLHRAKRWLKMIMC